MENVLAVNDLKVTFVSSRETVEVIRGVSFDIATNETLCIVGESGSGKSVTAKSVLGILPPQCKVSGSINFQGKELISSPMLWNNLRGQAMSIIFQNPFKALNPTMTIGKQISEVLTFHQGYSQQKAKKVALEFLDLVRIQNPKSRFQQYPFEFEE